MASINHPLFIPHLLGVLLQKASELTALMQKQDLEISGTTTSRKGTTSLIENPTILIVENPGWLTILYIVGKNHQ